MKYRRSFYNVVGLFITGFLGIPIESFADNSADSKKWHAVAGVESGVAIITNAGRPKNFPIENEDSDEFYNYDPDHRTKAPVVYGGFLGAEYRNASPWSVQITLDYNQYTPFSVTGSLTQGVDVASEDTYNYKYSVRLRRLLAETKIQYGTHKIARPYLLGGMGPAFNRATNYSTTVPSEIAFTRMYKSHTSASFSYTLGAGIDFDIIQYLRIGFGYRFANLGKVALGSATIDDVSVSGTLSQSGVFSNEFLAQLTAVF